MTGRGNWPPIWTSWGEGQGYLVLFEVNAAKTWEERIRWEKRVQGGKPLTLVGM